MANRYAGPVPNGKIAPSFLGATERKGIICKNCPTKLRAHGVKYHCATCDRWYDVQLDEVKK